MMKQSNNLCSDSLELKTEVFTFPRTNCSNKFTSKLAVLVHSSVLIITENFFQK